MKLTKPQIRVLRVIQANDGIINRDNCDKFGLYWSSDSHRLYRLHSLGMLSKTIHTVKCWDGKTRHMIHWWISRKGIDYLQEAQGEETN